jgi:hypothetical protein
MSTPDLSDVLITHGTRHHLYLTDRRGRVLRERDQYDSQYNWRKELSAKGLDFTKIDLAVSTVHECFTHEVAFLAYLNPAPGTSYARVEDGIHLLIEFEITDAPVPHDPLDLDCSIDEVAAWRSALQLHAPLAEKVATFVRQNCPDSGIQISFDLTGIFGANICAYIPLGAAEHAEAITNLMFDEMPELPTSNHEQLEALSRMRWRYDPDQIPPSALPGAACPIKH